MNEKESLKVGLVGCGEVANWAHLPSLKKVKRAEVVAVCDVAEKVAASTTQRFHIRQYYTDFSQMLAREKLDIMDICTPPDTHAAIAIPAIMGLSKNPMKGYNIPAAIGIPIEL